VISLFDQIDPPKVVSVSPAELLGTTTTATSPTATPDGFGALLLMEPAVLALLRNEISGDLLTVNICLGKPSIG
jgi:hypothetical protein